jgi:hypothetical protein
MEDVAQLVRASDCGSEGRGFEALHSPLISFAVNHIFSTENFIYSPFYFLL